jgi:hypothetical protein
VLKSNGYNLEHNFGHGEETLASVLVRLNLLAFAFHTAAYLGLLAWGVGIVAEVLSSIACCRVSPATSCEWGQKALLR